MFERHSIISFVYALASESFQFVLNLIKLLEIFCVFIECKIINRKHKRVIVMTSKDKKSTFT